MNNDPKSRRCLLKISGEAFSENGNGLSQQAIDHIADEIVTAASTGIQLAVVVGGGNFLRGARCALNLIERTTKDQMGMLATVMNALAIADVLIAKGQPANVLSSVEIPGVVPRSNARVADACLDNGEVVVFAGGTGNPFVTTDSTAALRAIEINADCILKATTVDGVYDKDPNAHDDAVKYERLSFCEALQKELGVMDYAAFYQCREYNVPIMVFDYQKPGAIVAACQGEQVGTLVSKEN